MAARSLSPLLRLARHQNLVNTSCSRQTLHSLYKRVSALPEFFARNK
jgi:hypothetical protein